MKNKIIIIASCVIVLSIIIFAIVNRNPKTSNNEDYYTTGENLGEVIIEDNTIVIDDCQIINNNNVDEELNKRVLEDIEVKPNKIYSYSNVEVEAGTTNQYTNIIETLTGDIVDNYWVVPVNDEEETLYWYDTNNQLQSYDIIY